MRIARCFPSLCPTHIQSPANVRLGQSEIALLDQGFQECQPDPFSNPFLCLTPPTPTLHHFRSGPRHSFLALDHVQLPPRP